ncbi:hypothetical protein [Planococcus sp. CAU13]|uniref:hypothetical protein n=1 Tax=Planococcus sp. CAU13 TaxID=1541197 RepID=UPI00052FE260|nr:hypothetical protein [Planococcus sp. CAU13]
MKKSMKLIGGMFLFVVTLFLVAMYVTDYMNGMEIGITDVLVFLLLLSSWFQFFTWGSDPKVQKDEMGKSIFNTSAKLSYFILTGSIFTLWVVDRMTSADTGEFGNLYLFIALCFAVMLFPIIQFFVARKYALK